MLVINLWGGPGAGKTTTAAGLFNALRHKWHLNLELVTEFATDLCFEQARENLKNQIYLLGNQYHRLWRLQQIGVEAVITDAPIGLNDVYGVIYKQPYGEEMKALIAKLMDQFDHVNILMKRDPNAVGGFKGGSKKRDRWFVDRFDKLLSEHGPAMDTEIKYSIDAHYDILNWLEASATEDGPIKYSYWKWPFHADETTKPV